VSVVVRRQKQASLLAQSQIGAVAVDELEPQRAQLVVDCTGEPDGIAAALSLVESRGTIVMKSSYRGDAHADLTQVVRREIRLVGSRCGPFDAALRLLKAQLVDVESLIEAHFPFDDALAAVDCASGKGVLKVLLDF
jgi:threonine dehydrogenase-like Zn-dependent dehydrogenase